MTKPQAAINMEKALENIDWAHYHAHVEWGLQRPDCQFYDGESAQERGFICPVWQDWLIRGRTLYPNGKEGLSEYLGRIKRSVPEGFLKIDHKRIEDFLKGK